jgi:predicted transcriptional regulator
LIKKHDYSQFPIYDEDEFVGLLTENGITRWLAKHVTQVLSLVDFEEIPVSALLQEEEMRENVNDRIA